MPTTCATTDTIAMNTTSFSPRAPGTVSLADEEAVERIITDDLFGLGGAVNNLTRLRPSKQERYRVTVFGSARTEPGHRGCQVVRQMYSALSAMGCDIVTGGGPSLMQAGNAGAQEAQAGEQVQSIGIRVDLLGESTRLEPDNCGRMPAPGDPAQQVGFGTGGHRGSTRRESFNEAHTLVDADDTFRNDVHIRRWRERQLPARLRLRRQAPRAVGGNGGRPPSSWRGWASIAQWPTRSRPTGVRSPRLVCPFASRTHQSTVKP
jgi:hypothetical protein